MFPNSISTCYFEFNLYFVDRPQCTGCKLHHVTVRRVSYSRLMVRMIDNVVTFANASSASHTGYKSIVSRVVLNVTECD